jgi:hypothetical protein
MDKICDQIRGANFLWVGNYTNNTFTPVANGSNQVGTALQVFSTTNSTPYYIYYLNQGTAKLYSITNGESTSITPGLLLASSITNDPCFWSENYQGTINTSTNAFVAGVNCTIRMRFQFKQYASPNANTRSEYYSIQTRATPRSPTFY